MNELKVEGRKGGITATTTTAVAGIAQLVQRIAAGYKVRGSNLGRGRDFPHPSRPTLGPNPISCTMGTEYYLGESGRGVVLTTHPI